MIEQILGPFFTAGYEQIVYMSSALDLPLSPEENLITMAPGVMAIRISGQLKEARAANTLGFSEQVAKLVLTFSAKNFQTFLQDQLAYCGQGSDLWAQSYEDYQKAMIRDIKGQVAIELKKTTYSSEELKILEHLVHKLIALLDNQVMTGAPLVPLLDGKMPLTCPTYMMDMMSLWTSLEKPVSLVSSQFSSTILSG